MVVWGSFRPFLSSLGTRGVRTPFFFSRFLAQKNLIAIFFYNFSWSSCAGEFSHHFVCGKSLHVAVFFPWKKISDEKKNYLQIFFLKFKNHVLRFTVRAKIADFRKNAEKLKHWLKKTNLVNVWKSVSLPRNGQFVVADLAKVIRIKAARNNYHKNYFTYSFPIDPCNIILYIP